MPLGTRTNGRPVTGKLPPEVYASHVEALFSGTGTFAVGVAGSSSMMLVAGIAGWHLPIMGIAFALGALGAVRLWSMKLFIAARPGLDDAGLKRWEDWYIVGGSAYLALLGLADLVAFGFTDDAFARLGTMVVTMAYLVGTPGRSFASPLLVNVQIVVAAVPVLAGLALAGGWNWSIGILVLVPFFVALKAISNRLNGIFVSAVVRASELSRLARRFDTALNNIPQGLAMFEADRTIAIVNERLLEILGVTPGTWHNDSTLEELVAAWREVGPAERLMDVLSNAEPSASEFIVTMSDGRSASVRLQLMNAGGGVLLVEDVTERVRAQEEINHLARYDPLTGMLNRRSFRAAVDDLVGVSVGAPALLFVDLDRFKQVNDTLGHVVGDRLVAAVAERLRQAAGPDATLGRFGGDEFVIYRVYGGGRAEAEQAGAFIIRRLSEPYDFDGQRITVGASVGIATSASSGHDVDDLLRDADLALYRAKAEGRGTCRVFEEAMKVTAAKRRRTEEDLRSAIARGEFDVHYQPIRNVAQRRFAACEALVRWRHPKRGLVPPGEFISIAEEAGLIGEIGEWVLRQACAECATWPGEVAVAVNFSAVQFHHGDAVAAIRRTLADTGLAPNRLEVEVTESLLLDDMQAMAVMLRQISAMGVRLSLDDFGTGYSSLSYLQSLPFNTVKIDQSFLSGLDRDSRAMLLLRGVQQLCSDLGMFVVMEGVETREQMALVVDHAKVDLVQGYFVGRPVPAVEIRALLALDHAQKVA